jgi:hypothetical protein
MSPKLTKRLRGLTRLAVLLICGLGLAFSLSALGNWFLDRYRISQTAPEDTSLPSDTDTSSKSQPTERLTDAELIKRVSLLTPELRALDLKLEEGMMPAMNRGTLDRFLNEIQAEFAGKYLGEARLLDRELRQRVKPEPPTKFPGPAMVAPLILKAGFLAGAHPLTQVATYLDDLAGKLPR